MFNSVNFGTFHEPGSGVIAPDPGKAVLRLVGDVALLDQRGAGRLDLFDHEFVVLLVHSHPLTFV